MQVRYALPWLLLVAQNVYATETPSPQIHGDWQVACAVRDGTTHCALVQQQASSANRQRVLAIELTREGDAAQGMLILPFGLSLMKGVQLSVDAEHVPPKVLSFHTCIPAGCLVPLKLDAAFVARLRSAALLKVTAATADGDDTAVFSVSLRGFSDAFDHAAKLSR